MLIENMTCFPYLMLLLRLLVYGILSMSKPELWISQIDTNHKIGELRINKKPLLFGDSKRRSTKTNKKALSYWRNSQRA